MCYVKPPQADLSESLLVTYTPHAVYMVGVMVQNALTPHLQILYGSELTITLESYQGRSLELSGTG